MSARKILIVLAIALTSCSHPTRDSRLDGTWLSDVETTVSYNRSLRPQLDWDKYSKLFGRMKHIYDKTTCTMEFDGARESEPLRIARVDASTVTLITHDPIAKKDRQLTIHFVGSDSYWIQIRDTDQREYFRRVRSPDGNSMGNDNSPKN